MSFYGNVINPPKFFESIQVDNNDTISVVEGGMVLHLVGDGSLSITKEGVNTIRLGQVIADGLYLKSSDWNDNDPNTQQYFKLMVDSKGVLSIYKVQKED